jgi:arylsulfatase A-like enzyme
MRLTLARIVWKYISLKGYGSYLERRGDRTTDAAIRWLEKNGIQNFFMWVHYFDPHVPYDPPPPYDKMYDLSYQGNIDGSMETLLNIWDEKLKPTPDDIRHIISLYDGEISFADQQIGVLIQRLEQMELLNQTIVIVTSDHGESLWEHDYYFKHGDFLYEASLRIPLIIFIPGETMTQKVIDVPTENIDIVPTILDLLKFRQPPSMQGESLLGLMKGEKRFKKTEGFSECTGRKHESDRFETQRYSIRTADWKFIRNEGGEGEIYYIKEDKGELHNLITSQPQVKEALERVLDDKLSTLKRASARTDPRDADTIRRLKSLGYIN